MQKVRWLPLPAFNETLLPRAVNTPCPPLSIFGSPPKMTSIDPEIW